MIPLFAWYVTRGGHLAKVLRTVTIAGSWRLVGYIKHINSNVTSLARWHTDGRNESQDKFDLIERVEVYE